MKKIFSNKWTYVAICMLAGLILGGIGLDKYESTIQERTTGAVSYMVMGGIMFLGAFIILSIGTKK